jgi:dTMP kinase
MRIAIDGIDGCGKSTQVRMLKESIEAEGYTVKVRREPAKEEGSIGAFIRRLLLQDEPPCPEVLGLLFAADRLHTRRHVESTDVVISDRSMLSSFAYQIADMRSRPFQTMETDQHAYLPQTDVERLEWLQTVNGYLRPSAPDMTFLLELPVETALARLKARYECEQDAETYYETSERLTAIADVFHWLITTQNLHSWCGRLGRIWLGERDAEQVHVALCSMVNDFFALSGRLRPLRKGVSDV